MNKDIKTQQGFTIIEVIMIAVILIIIAAIAIPRFVDLTNNPKTGITKKIAGMMSSANIINSASCIALNNVITANKCVGVNKCSDLAMIITPTLTLGTPGDAKENIFNLATDTSITSNGEEASCILQYLRNDVLYTSSYIVTGTGFSTDQNF